MAVYGADQYHLATLRKKLQDHATLDPVVEAPQDTRAPPARIEKDLATGAIDRRFAMELYRLSVAQDPRDPWFIPVFLSGLSIGDERYFFIFQV